MAKYIIEFEDKPSMVEAGLRYYKCKQVPYWSLSHGIIKNLTPYTEPDRKAIEDEVWEFANDCFWSMTQEDIDQCYDGWFPKSYQEAKAKHEAWKKGEEEIRVGDEVVYHGNKYVVGYVGADEVYHIVDRNWMRLVIQGEYLIFKTGRHFDEVEKLLERMREE